MQQIPHYNFMWHFCMIKMSIINRTIFSCIYWLSIRFLHLKVSHTFPFRFELFLFFFPLGDEVVEPRIGAGGIIGRVGEVDDVVIRADGETLYLAQLGQHGAELVAEDAAALVVISKRAAKDDDGSLLFYLFLLWTKAIETELF